MRTPQSSVHLITALQVTNNKCIKGRSFRANTLWLPTGCIGSVAAQLPPTHGKPACHRNTAQYGRTAVARNCRCHYSRTAPHLMDGSKRALAQHTRVSARHPGCPFPTSAHRQLYKQHLRTRSCMSTQWHVTCHPPLSGPESPHAYPSLRASPVLALAVASVRYLVHCPQHTLLYFLPPIPSLAGTSVRLLPGPWCPYTAAYIARAASATLSGCRSLNQGSFLRTAVASYHRFAAG